MEQAVQRGALAQAALEIPYNNLSTMYRHMGDDDKASQFYEQALRQKGTIQR